MRPVTFLSDYGTADEFVGVVHAVIARRAPGVPVIDLAHGIPRHGVLQGALTLARAVTEKFGGDSLVELRRNVEGYLAQVADRLDWE